MDLISKRTKVMNSDLEVFPAFGEIPHYLESIRKLDKEQDKKQACGAIFFLSHLEQTFG